MDSSHPRPPAREHNARGESLRQSLLLLADRLPARRGTTNRPTLPTRRSMTRTAPPVTLAALRRRLLGLLLFGLAGTATDLQ